MRVRLAVHCSCWLAPAVSIFPWRLEQWLLPTPAEPLVALQLLVRRARPLVSVEALFLPVQD
jgi:hypothetical protein